MVYERGEEWYSGPEPERVYLIWQPFAQGTFEVLLDPRISIEKRVVFFWQALHGLHILHEHGFMHRDIKLKNIGVVGIRRPRAVLLDFGQATFKSPVSPTPGGVGTKPYLAPEMEIDLYTNAVDIWALGVVGVQLFAMTDGKLPWHEIQRDRNRHSQLIQQLSSRETHLVDNLLAQMLKWDANARISATDALSHRCFATLDDAEKYPELNESNPRKRPLE